MITEILDVPGIGIVIISVCLLALLFALWIDKARTGVPYSILIKRITQDWPTEKIVKVEEPTPPVEPKPIEFEILKTYSGNFIVTILLIICVVSILPEPTPEEIAANEEKRLAIEKAEHEKEQAESSRYADVAPTLQSAIQAYGYRCGAVDMDSIVPFSWSGKNGFHVYCNGFQYGYEVEDVGGITVVTVK